MLVNGAQDARSIRQRYHLQSILTEVNCNIGALTPRRLLTVLIPSLMGNTFVVKAHAKPTPLASRLIQSGLMLPTHIYRDPRDAILSAMENGQRAIERGRPNAFTPMATFDLALKFMQDYIHTTIAWMRCKQALQVRYEELLMNYKGEADRLVFFLQLDKDNPGTNEVIERYRPEKAQADQKGMHFSYGRIGRFRRKMSPEQQETLARVLGSYLERMGYAL